MCEKMLMARDSSRDETQKLHKKWLKHQAFMAELAQNKEWLDKIEKVSAAADVVFLPRRYISFYSVTPGFLPIRLRECAHGCVASDGDKGKRVFHVDFSLLEGPSMMHTCQLKAGPAAALFWEHLSSRSLCRGTEQLFLLHHRFTQLYCEYTVRSNKIRGRLIRVVTGSLDEFRIQLLVCKCRRVVRSERFTL